MHITIGYYNSYTHPYYIMSGERKLWSEQEDTVLKQLRDKGIKKWSIIARIMQDQYNIVGRTGKQCRERWFNKLNPKINDDEWSQKDDKKLFKLHDELGNSWVKISKQFKGRTDNSIKNHFYSILRKALRKLNKFISNIESQSKDLHQLGSGLVSKIVNGADDKYDKKLFLPVTTTQTAHSLKNRLVPFAGDGKSQWSQPQKIFTLIKDLSSYEDQFDKHQNNSSKKRSKSGSVTHPEKQVNKQISDQDKQCGEEVYCVPERKSSFVVKADLLKYSSSFDAECSNFHQYSKRSSGSYLKPKSSLNRSEDGNDFLIKKLSTYSNTSFFNTCSLFPRPLSLQFEREAMMNSTNNIHGQFGEVPQKSEIVFERLDQK